MSVPEERERKPRYVPTPSTRSRVWIGNSYRSRDPVKIGLKNARDAGFDAGFAGRPSVPPADAAEAVAYQGCYRRGVERREEADDVHG